MGCIKPPANVTEPVARSMGRLAFVDTLSHPVMRNEFERLRKGKASNKDVGEFSEAVTAGLLALTGDALLMQHNPDDKPQGLDIQTLDTSGKIWAFEVKGTRTLGKLPNTDRYLAGRQGGVDYVHSRASDAPAKTGSPDDVGADADQIGSRLVQVNLVENEVTVWELDATGKRAGTIPLETYRLEDVVNLIDRS